jgi:hypothetical protein
MPRGTVVADLRSVAMTRWSYHVEAMNIPESWWRRKRQAKELTRLNQRLNNLGSAGWELVAYEATPMTGTFTSNIKGYAYLALFKQRIDEPGGEPPELWELDRDASEQRGSEQPR